MLFFKGIKVITNKLIKKTQIMKRQYIQPESRQMMFLSGSVCQIGSVHGGQFQIGGAVNPEENPENIEPM